MKLVHTGDWHLSSQRGKIDLETGLNARLMDFYRCARFTIEDGVKCGAELICIAGDLFNSCRPSPTEVRLCREALAPALDAGVPVVLCLGNHDAPRSPTERHALDLLRDTDGVTVADKPMMLNYGRAIESRDWHCGQVGNTNPVKLQIACLPWPNRQLLLADEEHRKLEPGQLNELVREKMLDVIRGLAGQLVPDVPAVLLGHFSVDIAEAGGMSRLMMLGGEWVLGLHDLTALPFDAICLGHVHKHQVLSDDDTHPVVSYCGSPECVTHGEEADGDKGYCLLDIAGDRVTGDFIPTPYRRFVTIDLTGDEPMPASEDIEGAIVKLRVPEHPDWDLRELCEQIQEAGVHELSVETQRAETGRRRETAMTAGMDVGAALTEWLKQNPDFEPMAEELLAEAQAVETAIAGREAI